MTTATTAVAELLGAAAQPAAATTPIDQGVTDQATAGTPDAPTPADAWEQIGVFRLNCGGSQPQLFYGPIDVAAALQANGVAPTPELLTALAHRKGRAPVVHVVRAAERGQPPTKRLAPSTVAAMLRDIGSSMQLQAAAM